MAGGIKISFLGDVRELIKSTQDVEQSLTDVADSLDDVARDGEKAEKSFKDAFDGIKRESRQAGDDVSRNVKRGFDGASEGVEDFKSESAQTAREVAASFDGSADSIAGAFQEVAAQAFQGFGPAGQAAGMAAALGIGFAISKLNEGAEAANELKERVIQLAQEISEVGGNLDEIDFGARIREWGMEIADAKSWFEPWQEESLTRFEQLERKADDLGLNVSNLFRGMSGHDPEAAAAALEEITARIEDYERQIRQAYGANGEFARSNAAVIHELTQQQGRYVALRRELEDASGVTERAVELQQRMDAALGSTAEAADRAREAQENYLDSLADAAEPVSNYRQILADKESAEREAAEAAAAASEDMSDTWRDHVRDVTVTIDDLIAELDRQAEQAASFNTNLAKITAAGGAEIAEELRAKGPEVAAAVAEVIAEASPDKQREYIERYAALTGAEIVSATARGVTANADQVGQAVADAFGNIPEQEVAVRANLTPWITGLTPPAPREETQRQQQSGPQPVVAILSGEDRALLQRLGNVVMDVTIPVYVDGQRIAEVVRRINANRTATHNITGRRSP